MASKPIVPSKAEQKELGWLAGYSVEDFSFCCGGREVGSLSCHEQPKWWKEIWGAGLWHKKTELQATPTKAWEKTLKDLREGYEGFPLMFNLVQGNLTELREILQAESDARLVHTWRNPNTDNVIEMWVLTNGSNLDYHDNDNY